MKKFLKNLKLETKLTVCLILMSLIIVGLSSVFLNNAINNLVDISEIKKLYAKWPTQK